MIHGTQCIDSIVVTLNASGPVFHTVIKLITTDTRDVKLINENETKRGNPTHAGRALEAEAAASQARRAPASR